MAVSRQDRNVLRELARQVAEIASLPVQQETISLWKALNGLKPVRPMVMIDQVCWHEMEVDGELALQTEDDFCREMETTLRRTLYSWRHMPADMVVEPLIEIPKVIYGGGFGIQVQEEAAVLDPENDVYSHGFIDQLQTESDLKKITGPELNLDEPATAAREEIARGVFDGILEVRMQGRFPAFNPWDAIVQWHNPQQSLLDLVERPEFMHQLISRLTEWYLSLLDQLEEQYLLGVRQQRVHCTGAHTDELPAPGFDTEHPRAEDLWTYGMAQMFSAVSPAMHQEFWLDYAVRWFSRFGLGYYGCCEPLDGKIDLIRNLPRVRKISMSPWVDVDRGAEQIGRDFVFSRKPNPAFLAREPWDPAAVADDLRDTLARCAPHGCPVELILKDISTVRYHPQRLWEWADIAMRVVAG
jgi:hypothetical protein